MRIPRLTWKRGMILLGLFLIGFGSVSWLIAQRTPANQVVRVMLDGAYLGIQMEDVTAENMAKYKLASETGVIVRSVEKGSPAETAGILENDVILEYAGIPVFSASGLVRLVQETPVSRTVNLGLIRDGKKISLAVKIGERQNTLMNDRLNRRLEVIQPGSGLLQFRTPLELGRSWNLALPRAVSRTQLGVTAQALTDQLAEFLGVPGKKGILISSVTAGSPAASVLRAGDVIISIDGKTATDPSDLSQAVAGKEPGSKVDLKVIRDKKEITLAVELPKSGTARRGVKI
jgi:serine protease Do